MRPALFALLLAAPLAAADPALDTQHIRLELSFDEAARSIVGRASETIRLLAPADAVELDAVELRVARVALAGGPALAFASGRDTLRVTLDRPYAVGETLSLSVEYAATPRRGVYFVGPTREQPRLPRQIWSSSWPEDARYWFPCHDQLADKATSELLLTLPARYQATGTGALLDAREQGKQRTWHFRMEQPHSTYLLSFVAGEYEEVREAAATPVPVSYLVYRGRAADARKTFGRTPDMLRLFSERTGLPYPYPKYAQAIAADFVFGGMENLTAVTLADRALLDDRARLDTTSDGLIAHELAHQWWGDTLTPASWADLWLSESFATLFAQLWEESDLGEEAASYRRVSSADAYFALSHEARSRPVVFGEPEDPADLLGPNVYERGALVLQSLRHMLGEDAFWRGVTTFLGRFAFRTARTADLEAAMEEAAGHPLGWFFDQWLRRPGHPHFQVAWRWDAEGRRVVLSVKHKEDPEGPSRVFRTPVDVRLAVASASRVERVFVERAEQEFSIPCESEPRSVVFDAGAWLLARIEAEKPLIERARDLAEGATAADRVRAARALTEPGAAAALAQALSADRFWGVRAEAATVLGKIGGATVLPVLRAGLRDADPRVRAAVAAALASAGSAAEADLLALVRGDPSELAVTAALRALGERRAASGYTTLQAALARPSHADRIAIAAIEGLSALGDRRAIPLLLEHAGDGRAPALRVAAVTGLGALGRGQGVVVSRLLRLLGDPWPGVRRAAAEALQAAGDRSALDPLRAALAAEDRSSVRRALQQAIEALEKA